MDNVETIFFLRGLVVGFSIAAPVGPIGVLCIRRTIAEGRSWGFVSGLGAATADAFYGSIAGFGLTFLTDLLVGQQSWLRLLGGAFLIYLGIKTFFSRPAERADASQRGGLMGAYTTTFFLTLTNPLTILSFAAIFAGLGLATAGADYLAAWILVLGVFTGSALWWLLLSSGVSLFRSRFSPQSMRWVNRISGSVITFFGLLAWVSL
jgi:threonine/homoserine/homoserine lactone efflux protein